MDKRDLTILAERFLRGVATEEEKALLHKWYDNWEDDDQIVVTKSSIQEEQLKQQILDGLKKSIAAEAVPLKTTRRRKYWLAAASLLLMATSAVYFIYSGKKNQQVLSPETSVIVRDAAPGSDKAVLTLSDGSTILLDSAQNGNLAQQGTSKVIKQNNGQIVYDASGAAAEQVTYNTIATPRGGQYHLVLADGSKVWLNASSSLHYPTSFTGAERKVELTGEAYFEVKSLTSAGNKKMPFIVNVKNMDVKVLGTAFNVNAYDDEEDIRTTLLEGRVDITGLNNTFRQLKPNDQSVYDRNGNIRVIENADTEQAIAWKNGLFKFNSTSLSAIMRQVSRWYDVDIFYKGDVKEETFSGDIPRRQNATEVFKVLETTKTVQFSIENKNVIIEAYKK